MYTFPVHAGCIAPLIYKKIVGVDVLPTVAIEHGSYCYVRYESTPSVLYETTEVRLSVCSSSILHVFIVQNNSTR